MIRLCFITGTFKQCILSCNRDPVKLGIILRDNFPSFYDMNTYDNEKGIYRQLTKVCDVEKSKSK
jgi:hypothetical protein